MTNTKLLNYKLVTNFDDVKYDFFLFTTLLEIFIYYLCLMNR